MLARIIPAFLLIFIMCGCCPGDKPQSAIQIDNINITKNEFDDAFQNSPYASSDTPASRRDFLDNLSARMLILRQAEKMGMDKDPEFLKSVQFFWQQSLVKMMLDRKIKELSLNIRVSDSDINDYYKSNKDTEFKDKDLSLVYDQIKWIIMSKKQKALLDDWVASLRKGSKVVINSKALNIEE